MARSEWRDESRGLAQLPLTLYTPREKKKGRGGVGYNGTCQRRASARISAAACETGGHYSILTYVRPAGGGSGG